MQNESYQRRSGVSQPPRRGSQPAGRNAGAIGKLSRSFCGLHNLKEKLIPPIQASNLCRCADSFHLVERWRNTVFPARNSRLGDASDNRHLGLSYRENVDAYVSNRVHVAHNIRIRIIRNTPIYVYVFFFLCEGA